MSERRKYKVIVSDRAKQMLLNQQAPSWSGAFYIYKVRHDYGKHKTKIFFRKKLEGY